MKKVILISLIMISLLTFPAVTKVSAEGVSLGVSTWYCWWKFNDNDGMKLDPALLYGPVVSFRLAESWSLAGVFLYGKFENKENGNGGGSTDINRFDSDLSLNYNINRYLKIFGGVKLMGFYWDETNGTGTHMSAGPGLGIGTTLPLTEYLYFLFNISATGSYGKHKQPAHDPGQSDSTVKLTETGANSNISLAYYIAPASTSINLGFRYQYLFIDYKNEKEGYKDEGMSFYGITLSAVYSF
jgi:hypothetical protein